MNGLYQTRTNGIHTIRPCQTLTYCRQKMVLTFGSTLDASHRAAKCKYRGGAKSSCQTHPNWTEDRKIIEGIKSQNELMKKCSNSVDLLTTSSGDLCHSLRCSIPANQTAARSLGSTSVRESALPGIRFRDRNRLHKTRPHSTGRQLRLCVTLRG